MSKFEDALVDYKVYKEFLFKISPPEWQHKEKNETMKAQTEEDGQEDQNNEPQTMATKNSKYSFPNPSNKKFSSLKEIIRTSVVLLFSMSCL